MHKLSDEDRAKLEGLKRHAVIPSKEGSPYWRTFAFMYRLKDQFPDTPEGRLWAAVLRQAADDAARFVPGRLNSFMATDGRAYLTSEYIFAAEAVGLPSDYVTRIARETGVVCG